MHVNDKLILRTLFMFVVILVLASACVPATQPIPTAPLPTETSPPEPTQPPKPTDMPEPTEVPSVGMDIHLELPEGDLENGEYQFIILGCDGCHVRTPNGLQFVTDEELSNIFDRAELRMADPAYTGSATSNEEYVIESILLPRVYLVEGWWDEESMPDNYGERMTAQDLADTLAWIRTFE